MLKHTVFSRYRLFWVFNRLPDVQVHECGSRKTHRILVTLKDVERNYSASERELFSVLWALQILRPYLQYEIFTVFTDHHTLNWIFNITEPSGRLMRWMLRLAKLHFEIKYKEVSDNHQAHAPCSLLTGSPTVANNDDDILAFHLVDESSLDISSSNITYHLSTIDKKEELEHFL